MASRCDHVRPRGARTLIGLLLVGALGAADEADPLLPPPVPVPVKAKPEAPVVSPASTVAAPPAKAAHRILPPPDEALQGVALEGLRELFKDDYAKRKASDRLAL